MSKIELRLLGTPRLERAGAGLSFRRRKAIAVLSYLAVNDRPQSRDSLAALLWPELEESRARGNLRRELSLLRSEIGGAAIESDRIEVALDTTRVFDVDVLKFRYLIHTGRASASTEENLTRAARIYTDDFLAGFHIRDSPMFEDWRTIQAAQLQNELSMVLQKLVTVICQRHDFDKAIPYASRLVGIDPLHEANQRSLIEVLGWAGHWSAAQLQIDRFIGILQEELQIDPEPETVDLGRLIAIRRLPPPGGSKLLTTGSEAQRLHIRQSAISRKSNLPVQRSVFVGRQREINEVGLLLADPSIRVISIIGAGGIGKTRLALAVAGRQLQFSDHAGDQRSRFADGVFFVDLSQASSTTLIIRNFINILGLEPERDSEDHQAHAQQLTAYLHNKKLLLVLDNAEHIQVEVAAILSALDQASSVKFLVTSREHLHLYGEHVYYLQGLEYPDSASQRDLIEHNDEIAFPAMQLFEQSARRALHDFQLNTGNVHDVAEIARIVQGMPLALELAGSWIHLLAPGEILVELKRGIDLLETSDLDVPERQQSIRVIFDATWEKLSSTDREILARLSVFQGGFSRVAAQEVTAVTLPGLLRLTHRSLIQHDQSTHRYYIHDLLRKYLEMQREADVMLRETAEDQHSAYFCSWVQDQAAGLFQQDQHQVAELIRSDYANVHTAWTWAVRSRNIELISRAVDGFGHFFTLEGRYQEGRAEYSNAADACSAVQPQTAAAAYLTAHVLTWKSIFERFLGEVSLSETTIDTVLSTLDQSFLRSIDTRWLRAFLKLQMAGGFFVSGDLSGLSYQESRKLFIELDDRWGTAMATAALGYVAFVAEDYDQAFQMYLEALTALRDIGDRRSVVYLLGRLSSLARYQGKWSEAEQYARESLDLVQETGTQGEIADALGNLGGTLFFLGKFRAGVEILAQADQILNRLGATGHSAAIHLRLGMCFGALGHLDKAREHLVSSRDQYASVDQPHTVKFIETQIAMVDIAEGDFERARQILDTCVSELDGPESRVDLSWFIYLPGVLAWRQGRLPTAIEFAADSLQLSLEVGGFIQLHWSLLLSALVLDEMEGCGGEAAVAWIHVLNQPWIANNVAFHLLTARRINERLSTITSPGKLPDPYTTGNEHLHLIRSLI